MQLTPERQGKDAGSPAAPDYIAPGTESYAAPAEREPAVRYVATEPEPNLGGGFIEFLFNGGTAAPPRPPSNVMARGEPAVMQQEIDAAPTRQIDPKFQKQMV